MSSSVATAPKPRQAGDMPVMENIADVSEQRPDTQTLTQKAYHALEEQIVTLELRPGTVLSEAGIAKSLSIGRTPVREALQRLASEGLVTVLPRRGILVSDINPGQQIRLLSVRRELERLIAKEAARRRTAVQAQAFARLATGFAEAARSKDDVVFMRLDREFNKLLLEACDNPFAANAMRAMQGLSRRFWYHHYKQFLDLSRCALLHETVARAVADGVEDVATKASDHLIDYIEEFSRATV